MNKELSAGGYEVEPMKDGITAYAITIENDENFALLDFKGPWKTLTWEAPDVLGDPEKLARSLRSLLDPKRQHITAAVTFVGERGRTHHSESVIGKKSTQEHKIAMRDPSRIKEINYHGNGFRFILKNPAYHDGAAIMRIKLLKSTPFTPELIDWIIANHALTGSLPPFDPVSSAAELSTLSE